MTATAKIRKFGQVVFVDKFSKVVIKTSPRKSGYLASTYTRFDGSYVGCKHINYTELDDFIKYQLDDYKCIDEMYN